MKRKNGKENKSIIIALIFLFFPLFLYPQSQTFFQRGEDLLLKNQIEDARTMFEASLNEEPGNEKTYLYLAYIYEQQKRYDRAVAILQRGLSSAKVYADSFYLNLGNNFFAQDRNTIAEEMYTKALEKNSSLAAAYLNRANARMKLTDYNGALEDYRIYLQLEPQNSQRESIERVTAILANILQEQEQKKREEEEKRLLEEQRQKALLGEVLSSLQNASEGTLGISAQSETIESVEEEFDIMD